MNKDNQFVKAEKIRLDKLDKKHRLLYEQELDRIEEEKLYETIKTNKIRYQFHNCSEIHEEVQDRL